MLHVKHSSGMSTARVTREVIDLDLLALLPDLRLEVPAHAVNGNTRFARWVMHATGANGPFQLDGVDCVRTRDGLVVENHINFDSARSRALVGPPGWAVRQTGG
jgi:hypothetical protein